MSVDSTFQLSWLDSKLYPNLSWLQRVNGNINAARCGLCHKEIKLARMGIQALKSHERSTSHKKAVDLRSCQADIGNLFRSAASSSSQEQASAETDSSRPSSDCPTREAGVPAPHVSHWCLKDSTVKAEILWALKSVMSHHSYRSADGLPALFRSMFPDSQVARQFSVGRDKMGYVITFGLAPYFNRQLVETVSACDYLVVCFDEALNKVAQRCQMDLVVRFWDHSTNRVSTRYLTSAFLGRCTADNLCTAFKEGLKAIPIMKVVQISMDGPNVNWKFYCDLKSSLEISPDDPGLLDTGSCGLHVVNGGLQSGLRKTQWNINGFLRSLYYLFKDCPSRRAIYAEVTGSHVWPHKFCVVRWVENSRVAARALEMIPFLVQWIASKPGINGKTLQAVKIACADKLLIPKLHFFKSVCLIMEPFLREFQAQKPLFPLLYGSLSSLVKSLIGRLVKPKIVESTRLSGLMEMNLTDLGNLKAKVELGFGAMAALNSSKATELEKVGFYSDCRKLYVEVITKILQKSPLAYKFTRAASCLSIAAEGKCVAMQDQNAVIA